MNPKIDSTADDETNHDVLAHLASGCGERGMDSLAERLTELRAWMRGDLSQVEAMLDASISSPSTSPVHGSVHHLLHHRGKMLRPVCVALAARTGRGFNDAARDCAVAVELVHAATLLHDDVVDVGDLRRGVPTARVLYGNAASIFGGDFLLVEALGRIRATGIPLLLDRMLDVIRQMIVAESLQLMSKGRVVMSEAEYLRIASGKTASLFAWALFAGACAGGVEPEGCDALAAFGRKLGLAFQIVDDVLDLSVTPAETGKTVLTDLREGKTTHPVLLAVQRDASICELLEAAHGSQEQADNLAPVVAARVVATGALEESRSFATRLSTEAVEHLSLLSDGPAKSALVMVALAASERRR